MRSLPNLDTVGARIRVDQADFQANFERVRQIVRLDVLSRGKPVFTVDAADPEDRQVIYRGMVFGGWAMSDCVLWPKTSRQPQLPLSFSCGGNGHRPGIRGDGWRHRKEA